jgi:ATP phosphoribosyltransferase regulatory subunit
MREVVMNFLKIEDEMKYFQKMFILRKEIENFLFEEGYMNIEPSIFEEYDEFTSVNSRIDKKSTVKILGSNSDILILSPDITTGIINKFMPRWDYDLMLKIFYYGKTYKYNGTGIKENREIGVERLLQGCGTCLGRKIQGAHIETPGLKKTRKYQLVKGLRDFGDGSFRS